MKKKLYLMSTILLSASVLSLSSCLKDDRYVDFTKNGAVVDFPLGGTVNFGPDAITEAPADDDNGTITRQFAVNIATPKPTSTETKITLAVDNSLVDSYNAANTTISYEPMPADAFVFTQTSVTIPAGKNTAIVSVTFYKNLLDPSKSYMLPIKIASASQGTISGNMGVHYYHFIGNDFAGSYNHYYDRWNIPDSTAAANHDNVHVDVGPDTFFPVTATEFTVITYYYYQPPYHVKFTKTGTGASATYSNFTVDFTAADIDADFTQPSSGSVVLVNHPKIVPSNGQPYDPTKQYTYAEALKLFRFYYTTGTRAVIDTYTKP